MILRKRDTDAIHEPWTPIITMTDLRQILFTNLGGHAETIMGFFFLSHTSLGAYNKIYTAMKSLYS